MDDLFILQPMVKDQIPAIAEIVAENRVFQRYQYNPQKIIHMLETAYDAKDILLTALENGKVRGFVWMQEQAVFGMSAYVKLIAVDYQHHQRGIGQLLMTAVESIAQKNGPNLFVLTSMDNLIAQKFYLRLGYESIGVIRNYVLPGVDELMMRKTWGSLRKE
ncbi:dTDP-fucosamine acetyltransferase [bioreactor metagenome]|uniref:dTDP-fucosamine acetyltransferase n=1 Tax=bioreactor metagenome TaxID=1076179 RepID=A0A644YJH6_9ZZZZ